VFVTENPQRSKHFWLTTFDFFTVASIEKGLLRMFFKYCIAALRNTVDSFFPRILGFKLIEISAVVPSG
jgi:hypothetical protein